MTRRSDIIQDGNSYMVRGGQAFFTIKGQPPTLRAADAGADPTSVKAPHEYGANPWARWGESDDLPEKIKQNVEANPVLRRALSFRTRAHFGRGIVVYREQESGGRIERVPVRAPEVDQLMRDSDFRRTQPGFISDHEHFANLFPEVILNVKGDRIVEVRRQQAYHARWEKMKGGRIRQLFLSSDYTKKHAQNKPAPVPALDHVDPMGDLRERAKSRTGGRRFILPMRVGELGQVYYEKPEWLGVIDGWLPLAYKIPRMKAAILKNQMRIRYHVQIPYDYYKTKYENWETYDQEKRDKLVLAEIISINDWLTGETNAGKTWITHFKYDATFHKEFPGIRINPVQDTFKEGEALMDASAANTEILWAVGIDPTLIGVVPGATQAGSGSNKREAFSILQASMYWDRERTLEPWRFALEYNGIDPEIQLGYRDIDTVQTLNQNPTGSREVM